MFKILKSKRSVFPLLVKVSCIIIYFSWVSYLDMGQHYGYLGFKRMRYCFADCESVVNVFSVTSIYVFIEACNLHQVDPN